MSSKLINTFDFITIQTNNIKEVLRLLNDITIKSVRTSSKYEGINLVCRTEIDKIIKYLLFTISKLDNLRYKNFKELLKFISDDLIDINIIIQNLNIFNTTCVRINPIIFDNLNDYINYSDIFVKIAKLLIPQVNKSIKKSVVNIQEKAALIIQNFIKSIQLKAKQEKAASVIQVFLRESLQKKEDETKKKAIEIIQASIKRSLENPTSMSNNLVYETINQVIYELEGLNKARRISSSMSVSNTIAEQMRSKRSLVNVNVISQNTKNRNKYESITKGLTKRGDLQTEKKLYNK